MSAKRVIRPLPPAYASILEGEYRGGARSEQASGVGLVESQNI